MVRVYDETVKAPVETEVTLRCRVEASPRAMNTWFRYPGKFRIMTKIHLSPVLRSIQKFSIARRVFSRRRMYYIIYTIRVYTTTRLVQVIMNKYGKHFSYTFF